jgi:long-chain acyl-CoA synthetase
MLLRGLLKEEKTLQRLVDGLADYGTKPVMLKMVRDGSLQNTYREMADRVFGLCGGLMARGVSRGERIGILSEPRFEAVAATLAVLRVGAVVVPVDVQFPDQSLSTVLEDSGITILFTTAARRGRLQRVAPKVELILLDKEPSERAESGGEGRGTDQALASWLDLISQDAQRLPSLQPNDYAALFYTSGTTGPPKGVPLSHAYLAFQLETIGKENLISEKDRVLLPLPLHHVYPFVIGIFVPLFLGASIVLPSSLTGPEIIRALQKGRVTAIIGVPRLYHALLTGIKAKAGSAGAGGKHLFSALLAISKAIRRGLGLRLGKGLFGQLHNKIGGDLRIVASGGSMLDPKTAWELEAMGWQVAMGYGLTETSPLLTLNPPGKARIGSVGRPVDGVDLRIDPSALSGMKQEEGQDFREQIADALRERVAGLCR